MFLQFFKILRGVGGPPRGSRGALGAKKFKKHIQIFPKKNVFFFFQNVPGASGALPGGPGGGKNGKKYQNYEFLEIGPSSPNETS